MKIKTFSTGILNYLNMAILSDINSAIDKMDAALFQELGDELLYSIYKPINIESRGTKEGQVKTVTGSPDTIFAMPNGKVLIEYTTQSNRPQSKFIKKLKDDIASCINVGKTKIPINEINEIVLFSNQRIAINIQDSLRDTLSAIQPHIKLTVFSMDDIAVKLRDFPSLLQKYLGISTFSGLVEIDSFIRRFSSTKFTYSTPLDNTYFEIEALPISKGLEMLNTNDIVIISGDAGMGKTRYAVEVAKAYSHESGAKTFVIEEKNRDIREILDKIDKNTSYLFIIDDANRTAIWEEAIEFYECSQNNNVKFIATVRSYALDTVIAKCSKLSSFGQIEMSESPEELASNILTSFGITNHLWHKRINEITGKNIRLAVMCAQIAMAGEQYNDLLNVEGIYDAYYKPTFNSLMSDYTNRVLIKIIAIVSFYKVVDLEDDSLLEQVKEIFGIEKSEFKTLCHKLDELECISITTDEIATIPDQNLGTYIFYQCFYVLKELSLSNLIEKLHHRRDRLRDSIFSVWNCFHKKDVIDYSKRSISEAWKVLSMSIKDEREICEFLETFGSLIPDITFLYIRNYIQRISFNGNNPFRFGSDSIISILSHFSHSEESAIKTALTLMVEYLKVSPQKLDNAAETLSEHWLYDEMDYANSYKRLTAIIDTLIDLSKDSETGLLFAGRMLPSYLKFTYQYTRTRGRKFVFGHCPVIVTDELKANRIKIWEWINTNISSINQDAFIKDLYDDLHYVKHIAKQLVGNEIAFLNEFISKLNITEDFNVCNSLAALNNRVKFIMGHKCLKIDWSLANPLYTLDCQIIKGCERKFAIEYDIERKNISEIVKKKSLPELKCLINDINQIAIFKNIGDGFRISYVIEGTLELCIEKGIELCQYCIDQGFHFIPSRIISTYLDKGYDLVKLVCFANNQERSLKSDLLLAFVSIVDNPSSFISEQEFCKAIQYHKLEWYNIGELCKRYYSNNKLDKGYPSVFATILWRFRNDMSTSGTEAFLSNFCKHNKSKINLVVDIYINSIRHQDSFDCGHKLLKYVLQLYPQFWIECCKAIPTFVNQYHINPYDFIWDIKSYPKIIESTLLYYSSRDWIQYDEKENLFSFFCNIKGDKAANFLDERIRKYSHNTNISSILFEIVATYIRIPDHGRPVIPA